jgi:hypothetical protein
MANLFTGQTPTLADNSDGTPGITAATTIVFATDGTVTGVRFYATTTASGVYTGGLWTVDSSDPGGGTLLQQKTMGSAPTGGAWNAITFDTPISVTAGAPYRVGVFSGDGRYVATLAFFSSAGLTNGDISAPQHNTSVDSKTVTQGTFRIDASFGYPNANGNGTSYFVDVEFTSGDSSISPSGIGVPVTLGAPSASFAASAGAPAGIEVPVTLGAPSASFAASAGAPAGIEVPVTLGAPGAFHYITPAGIEVLATLGAPTVEAPPGPSPVTEAGSWFALLAAVQSARSDAELNRERERHPVECPYDGWPLTPTARGLHCEFGGHVITPRL